MERVPVTIGDLLLEHLQEYERKVRRVVTQKEFAEYIGIPKNTYNHIATGRRPPSAEVLDHLVKFFDDLRFYDVLGLPRPVEDLKYIQSSWGRLPKQIRDQMYETAKKYITELEKQK